MDSVETHGGVSRRKLLVAGAGTALAATAVAACGGGSGSARSATSASGASGGGSSAGTPSSSGGPQALAKVAEVPVGGVVSATGADGKPLIVSQPAAGTVVAFSAVCTHQGCTVAPAGKILQCPCHGSTYDLATGKNTGGPAPSPLARVPVRVKGGKVVET